MLAIAKYLIPAEIPAGIAVIKYCLGKSAYLSSTDKKLATVALIALGSFSLFTYLEKRYKEKDKDWPTEWMNFSVVTGFAMFPVVGSYFVIYSMLASYISNITQESLFSREWTFSVAKVITLMSLLSAPSIQLRNQIINKYLQS
ncbi:hypothetical protein [Rhabdochlamydiaceae symbiont of Dictyostelium giganteum]|uniref:hypothetical protein n=1 Tax=Rhabdochlamydiaceae symbiont of Dictyostelium giganteum TaxID=3342349 RepID=UPI00384BFFE0